MIVDKVFDLALNTFCFRLMTFRRVNSLDLKGGMDEPIFKKGRLK
jgi:hypothetical protein